ncbi:MAG: helix-turn-helix domain-containing protein [Sphingomonadales bacterium]
MRVIHERDGVALPHPEHAASTDAANRRSPRDIGDELREVRMGAGKALKDIAVELRIRADHLRAIEDGEYDRLPGPAYVAGFVRSYASYLGFDGAEITAHLHRGVAEREAMQPLVFPEPAYDGRMRSAPIAAMSALVVVLGMLAWMELSGDEPDAQLTVASLTEGQIASIEDLSGEQAPAQRNDWGASPADRSQAAETLEKVASTVPSPERDEAVSGTGGEAAEAPAVAATTNLPASDAVGRVTIRATEDAWMSIHEAGRDPLFEGMLRAGETVNLPGGVDLLMTTGNAGGLEIAVDGTLVEAIGPVGGVMRGVSLNPEHLRMAAGSGYR